MVKKVYAKGWRLEPFKHGRPFVKLKDYEELKEKYDNIKEKNKEK